jgi:UDP-N-acetylglucosamine--N-acetylmuramyl-(pentapeptide) pyrophosphoryl-undecaprenol N-acetylglucosamine transferase
MTQQSPIRVVIAGGGTAGHIYPALAVGHALLAGPADGVAAPPPAAPPPAANLLFLHGPRRIDDEVLAHAGVARRRLDVGPIRGTAPHHLARNLGRLARGVLQARSAMAAFRPHVVLATGGYVSAPSILAGRLCGVPVVLYLPDASPGLAVRVLAPLAVRIALSFPATKRYFRGGKAIVTGYPVRPDFLHVDRDGGRAAFDLSSDLPVVLVMGGSTGAHAINRAVGEGLEPLLHHAQVIHLCGDQDEQPLRRQRAALTPELRTRYRLFRCLHRGIADAMAASDLIVCRAGASTLAELPILRLPAILIPGAFAGGHQQANADFLVEHGAAVKVAEQELAQDALLAAVLALLDDRHRLHQMADAMGRLARPEAADNIATLVRSIARRRR